MRCGFTAECPSLYERSPGGDFIAIGELLPKEVTNRAVAENETIVLIPREVALQAFREAFLPYVINDGK